MKWRLVKPKHPYCFLFVCFKIGWLYWVICASAWILELIFQFCEKSHWNSDGVIESVNDHSHFFPCINSADPWAQISFHLSWFTSSSWNYWEWDIFPNRMDSFLAAIHSCIRHNTFSFHYSLEWICLSSSYVCSIPLVNFCCADFNALEEPLFVHALKYPYFFANFKRACLDYLILAFIYFQGLK